MGTRSAASSDPVVKIPFLGTGEERAILRALLQKSSKDDTKSNGNPESGNSKLPSNLTLVFDRD